MWSGVSNRCSYAVGMVVFILEHGGLGLSTFVAQADHARSHVSLLTSLPHFHKARVSHWVIRRASVLTLDLHQSVRLAGVFFRDICQTDKLFLLV